MIVLEMKCPQLSKPEEPKLHRWQNGEKTLGKPGSVGGPIPLRPEEPVVCSNCSKVRV